jgi:hypothetical protein
VLHTALVSTPAPPPFDATPTVPAVPYGGAVDAADPATVSTPFTAKGVAKGVGQVAVAMTIRTVIFFVLKAILKAIFKR